MWVAAVICFIAFGIELARGNVTCFDNVSYISVSDRDRDKEREDSRLKQSLLAACFYGYIFLPPAVLGHHPHCCCCGNWLLWLLSRVQEYQHHSQLQEPGATGQLHITNKKVNVHTQLECINKGLYAIISLLISFTASYCDPRRPEKPDQRLWVGGGGFGGDQRRRQSPCWHSHHHRTGLQGSSHTYTAYPSVVEEVGKSFTEVKVAIPQLKILYYKEKLCIQNVA